MSKPFIPPIFQTAYSPTVQVFINCDDHEFRAKQSFAAECDVNNILAQYDRTGMLSHLAKIEPRYGDTTGFDFTRSMDLLNEAEKMFMGLPASMRAEFDNQPANFFEFVQNPQNRDEAIKMGLIRPSIPPSAGDQAKPVPTSAEGGNKAS